MTLLDEWIPSYDTSATHTTRVNAAPRRVYDVARSMDLGTAPLVRVLMGLRAAPAAVVHAFAGGTRAARGGRPEDASWVARMPFVLLAEDDGREFVLGLVGRFWTPTGGLAVATVDDFRSPPPAGLAQAMWNFRVEPRGAASTLTTETRVRCADQQTRRHFLRYWRVVRFGSALTRRSMLRRIRLTAEREN